MDILERYQAEKQELGKNFLKKSCSADSTTEPVPDVNTNIDDIQPKVSEHDDNFQEEWVFLEDVPEYMKCNIICCNVFVSPQLLTCCGRSICLQCIESHLRRVAVLSDQRPSCPVCRSEGFKMIENAALEVCINQLKVQCLYKRKGCGWTGTLQNGKLHLKECDFFPIACPNKCDCEKIQRCDLSKHMAECPLQSVRCNFESIGCSTEDSLVRRNVHSHSENNVHHHLFLVAQTNLKISTECSAALAKLELKWRNNDKQAEESVPLQKDKLAHLKSNIAILEDSLREKQENIEQLKQEIAKQVECLVELRKNNEQAKSNTTACDLTLEQVQTLKTPKTKGISCPPVLFTINCFHERMTNRYKWLSSPFYTHPGGYKMCLSMNPISTASEKDDKLSFKISVHMMMGEFDDHLQWPFAGAVVTISVTSRHSNHCNRSINLELDGERTVHVRSKQIDGSISEEYGAVMTFQQKQMESFLLRDRLTINVYRIQFLPV